MSTSSGIYTIIKAFSRTSEVFDGPVTVRVECADGTMQTISLTAIAAIQMCALLLGDTQVAQAIQGNKLRKFELDTTNRTVCSFCGKSAGEVGKLVVAAAASICNECTDLSRQIIEEESKD